MLAKLLRDIWGTPKPTRQPFWCPVCDSEQAAFSPLAESYLENARRYGFEHFEKAEMLSLQAYTCPDCGASDRERLYALWLDQYA